MFNGQFAFVSDTTQRPFVTTVIPVVGDFAAAQQPVIVVLNEGTVIEAEHILFEMQPTRSDAAANSSPVLQQTLQRAERDVILEALRAAHGSRRAVAEKLGISPRTLRYKLARIRNAGIEVPAA